MVRQLVAGPTIALTADGTGAAEEPQRVRRLSFAGALRSGRGDLAARAGEIVREELGRSA